MIHAGSFYVLSFLFLFVYAIAITTPIYSEGLSGLDLIASALLFLVFSGVMIWALVPGIRTIRQAKKGRLIQMALIATAIFQFILLIVIPVWLILGIFFYRSPSGLGYLLPVYFGSYLGFLILVYFSVLVRMPASGRGTIPEKSAENRTDAAETAERDRNSVLAIVLNFFIFPGLGTIVRGGKKEGLVQMTLVAAAIFLIILAMLFPFFQEFYVVLAFVLAYFSGLIWALVSEIRAIRKAEKSAERDRNSIISYDRALVAVICNFFILPGLGTIVGGRKKDGFIQIVMLVVAFFLIIFSLDQVYFKLASVLAYFGVWIWAGASGISMIRQAKKSAERSGR